MRASLLRFSGDDPKLTLLGPLEMRLARLLDISFEIRGTVER